MIGTKLKNRIQVPGGIISKIVIETSFEVEYDVFLCLMDDMSLDRICSRICFPVRDFIKGMK
jgi:hypothetical protein